MAISSSVIRDSKEVMELTILHERVTYVYHYCKLIVTSNHELAYCYVATLQHNNYCTH